MQSTTIKNEGMVSLNQNLRQRIIYNNLSKNTRNVMKLDNDPETDIIDKINATMLCVVGYCLLIVAATGVIALIAAIAH